MDLSNKMLRLKLVQKVRSKIHSSKENRQKWLTVQEVRLQQLCILGPAVHLMNMCWPQRLSSYAFDEKVYVSASGKLEHLRGSGNKHFITDAAASESDVAGYDLEVFDVWTLFSYNFLCKQT